MRPPRGINKHRVGLGLVKHRRYGGCHGEKPVPKQRAACGARLSGARCPPQARQDPASAGAPRQRQTPGVAGVKNDQLLHADFGALCSPMKHSWIPRHQRSTTPRIHELHERELPRRPLFVCPGASRRAMTQCHDLLNWRQSDWPRGAWQPLRDFPLNKGSTANRPPVAATVQAAKSKRMVNASQGRAEIVIGDGPAAAAVGPQSDVGSRWDTPPGLRAHSANVTLA